MPEIHAKFMGLSRTVSPQREHGALQKPSTGRVQRLCFGVCLAFLHFSGSVLAGEVSHYRPVLASKPAGYLPADEGEGTVLHDRSGHENHGAIYHTPRDNGLLEFANGFQCAETPAQDAYARPVVTVGGWLFTRLASCRRVSMLFMGIANPMPASTIRSLLLRMREAGQLEVFSGQADDLIGSVHGRCAIASNVWQHVIYMDEEGVRRLYLDGQSVRSKMGAAYTPQKLHLLIGYDADWWIFDPLVSHRGMVRSCRDECHHSDSKRGEAERFLRPSCFRWSHGLMPSRTPMGQRGATEEASPFTFTTLKPRDGVRTGIIGAPCRKQQP